MTIKTACSLLSLLILAGCDNIMTKPVDTSDDQLIEYIINADQKNVSLEDLPSLSISTINQDYSDYIEIDASMATGLGYQVSMDGKNYKPGDHNEVYFNLKGRKLIHKKGRPNRGDFKCLELVLPITFNMPDGSHIIVENENAYGDVKAWYINHPGSKEKPSMQYPVNIIYKDGITETIYDVEEMRSIKDVCRKRDDKKYRNCFKIEYPIIFILDDGSTISMEGPDDWAELKIWHEANPDSEKPAIQYPVVITYRYVTTKTINNDEEMKYAKENCRD